MIRTYDTPVLTVSAAAELAGMHAQTLRQYDRLGLVVPHRTAGRGRRYSLRDVDALRQVQALSAEGVNLEGIRRILALERENRALRAALEGLRAVIDPGSRVFAASPTGDVESVPRGQRAARRAEERRDDAEHRRLVRTGTSSALVLWREGR
ncbi:MerR family transcriptional regulator [Miniimonas arenae]|uniref:MerR family transcriptional regulator n=1 Tax=Miniimonas arenae TaxID=676201 RepID=A0A5C5BAC4_9MICO|nr:helix-turn-helix transcriptional regulator [Miniimonas arenae]TNU73429.1 MerR family transcriptional regulator [Miniimonas arenae]